MEIKDAVLFEAVYGNRCVMTGFGIWRILCAGGEGTGTSGRKRERQDRSFYAVCFKGTGNEGL